ncbi:MAG: sulfotransferase [Henriciella sp.]|nr:sulfotransferase [Henriciella sp.]
MSIVTLLNSARAALARRAYREAHTACMGVLQQDPANAEAFLLLGILTADHNNHQKAIELFDRALATAPQLTAATAYKSRSLIALNQRERALEVARAITDLDQVDPHTLDTLGVVLSRAGRHEEALAYYKAALRDGSDQANYYYNYGAALQFLGRMDEARDAYRQAITRDPDDARSYAAIVTITKQSEAENDIAKLEALFSRFAEDANARLNIGHAIAKAYDDLGQGARALEWLSEAKALKKQELAYDPAFDRAVFEQVQKLAGIGISPQPDALGPIFITGMPRTGTTLVDRIVSSHSQVTPAGELTDFGLLLKRTVRSPGPYVLDAETLAAGADADLTQIGAAYVAHVRKTIAISTATFTDKMPLNILYAPLLLKAMPNARVICLKRHPADTVLSNYRQLFATTYSYYNYAYDLETAARYYAQFDRLVEHFKETLPATRFTTVQYESVVSDIETETRRLLDFCGLAFEQACVEFHTNQAPVATASSAQVRQPLYTSALARWKRYRPGLDPMLNVLVEEGCLDPAELTD